MAWRCFGLVLLATGVALVATGVWVEIEVRLRVGGGFAGFLAWVFCRGDISAWRTISQELMIVGPLLALVGLLCFHLCRRRSTG